MSDDNPPVDGEAISDENETTPIEEHLKSRSTWLRFVFMLLFWVLAGVTTFVASVVIVFGFIWMLFTGETNEQLRKMGQGIAAYISQIINYLTYNTDDKPFPFGEWPAAAEDD
jgi:hypothetical protein